MIKRGAKSSDIDTAMAKRMKTELDKLYEHHRSGNNDEYQRLKRDITEKTGISSDKVVNEMRKRLDAELDEAYSLWLKDKNGEEYKKKKEELLAYKPVGGSSGFANEMSKRKQAGIREYAKRLAEYEPGSELYEKVLKEAVDAGYSESEVKAQAEKVRNENEKAGK